MVVLPLHGHWHLRRMCYRVRIRMVVHLLLRRTADHIPSTCVYCLHSIIRSILMSSADAFPPMLCALSRNWVRDVHERHGASGDNHEPVDPCYSRDVQRNELAIWKRESTAFTRVEEPVPCWGNNSQHGASFCYLVYSILHGQSSTLISLNLDVK